jgi:uncharacterized protein with LGFP repeats
LTAVVGAACAFAQPVPDAPPGKACGFALGAAAMAEWVDLGGQEGRLGCPTADETPASPSPNGTRANLAPFGGMGGIVVAMSGPEAGKAFAVAGCVWRLYFSYGGPGGWLGLPLEDAQNTPDGKTQRFEGGLATYGRAEDSCDAEPSSPATSESH